MTPIKLNATVNNKAVYLTATGLRVGTKGRVTPVGVAYGLFGKGTARRVRKALHAERRFVLAAMRAERAA